MAAGVSYAANVASSAVSYAVSAGAAAATAVVNAVSNVASAAAQAAAAAASAAAQLAASVAQAAVSTAYAVASAASAAVNNFLSSEDDLTQVISSFSFGTGDCGSDGRKAGQACNPFQVNPFEVAAKLVGKAFLILTPPGRTFTTFRYIIKVASKAARYLIKAASAYEYSYDTAEDGLTSDKFKFAALKSAAKFLKENAKDALKESALVLVETGIGVVQDALESQPGGGRRVMQSWCSGCGCQTSQGKSSGTISVWGSAYVNNADCWWIIASSGAITLSFSSLETESGYDYVTIKQCTSSSSCSSGTQLAKLSGSLVNVDASYESTTGYMQVLFTSDISRTYRGFVASWSTTVTVPYDTFSPTTKFFDVLHSGSAVSYEYSYADAQLDALTESQSLAISSNFGVLDEQTLSVAMHELATGQLFSQQTGFDAQEFGFFDSSTAVIQECTYTRDTGGTSSTLESCTNVWKGFDTTIHLRMVTLKSELSTAAQQNALITAVRTVCKFNVSTSVAENAAAAAAAAAATARQSVTCSGGCLCQPSTGTFSGAISDGTSDYVNDLNCSWLIASSGLISLSFSSFNTEEGYDFVTINRCTSSSSSSCVEQVARLGGSDAYDVDLSTVYTSSTGYMQVVFTSDQYETSSGFVASWTTPQPDGTNPSCTTEEADRVQITKSVDIRCPTTNSLGCVQTDIKIQASNDELKRQLYPGLTKDALNTYKIVEGEYDCNPGGRRFLGGGGGGESLGGRLGGGGV